MGDRLLALIEPLRRWREQQQGASARVFRVPPGMDGPRSARWKNTVLRDESIPEQEWPRYLLVLGGLDQVSLELQQALGHDFFVGRLAFRDEQQLAAYADKVLRWERAPPLEARARSLFFTAHDGTAATQVGYHQLVLPSLQACLARQQQGDFRADIQEIGGPADWSPQALLENAAATPPGVLLSVSHGLGAPRQGWRSAVEQQALQGAMCLGPGQHLRAEDVASRPFLAGGLWVYLACFGGGTPHQSPYFHWLRGLQEAGVRMGRPEAVLASLPASGQPPFIAALPQAALANPQGPLAIVAHVDLAWSYGFTDIDASTTRGRPSRFLGLLREWVEGRRAGVALSALLRFASEASLELTLLEDREASERAAGRAFARDSARRGHLWMMRQDVSGYVLLGDPAVRLPLAPDVTRAVTPSTPEVAALLGLPARPVDAPTGPGTQAMEEAVLELLAGTEAPKAIAARTGVSLAELRHWERVFREAGRAALAALSRSR
ncbi:hypothetical protein ACLESD_09050 [Pyxidicoccus sp. 3LFB2]